MTEFYNRPVHPQAEVTLNAAVDPKLKTQRTKTSRLPSQMKFGNVHTNQDLHLLQNELAFTNKHNYGSNKPVVFTKFNGLPTKETQEEFESQFKLLGQASGPYLVDEKDQPDNGVPLRVAGGTSIIHTGNKSISPGKEIEWYLHSIDNEKAHKQQANLPKINGLPSTARVALIREYDPKSILNQPRDAIYLLNTPTPTNIELLEPRNHAKLSDKEQFAITMKKVALTEIYTAIVFLAKRGLITINTPNTENARDRAFYNNFDNIFDLPVSKINQGNVTVSENGQELNYQNQSGDNSKFENSILFLGHKLGLLGSDANRPHLTEHEKLVKDLLTTVNAGLLENDGQKRQFSIDAMFPNTNAIKRTVRGTKAYDLTNSVGRLTKHQMDNPSQTYLAYELANRNSRSKVFAVTSSNLTPGKYGDIVFK